MYQTKTLFMYQTKTLSAIFCVYIYEAHTTHPMLSNTHTHTQTDPHTNTHKNKYKLSIVIRDDNVLKMKAAQIQRQATIGAIESG